MNHELKRLKLFVGATLTVAVNSSCGGNIALNPNETTGNNANEIGGAANGGVMNTGGALGGGAISAAISVSASILYDTQVPPCFAGYEHPNICCQGGPDQATICAEDLTHPFGLCEKGQFAYPDVSACCSLDNKAACLQPSSVEPTADAGQQAACTNPCYPGTYPLPESVSSANDSFCCIGSGQAVSCMSKAGHCESTGCSPICGAPCPAGWAAPAGGQVDLCCQTDSSGQSVCFSQSGSIGGYIGIPGASGPTGCTSEEFINDGNSYTMNCDFTGSKGCTCLRNGVVTLTLPFNDCDLALCGFPPLPP